MNHPIGERSQRIELQRLERIPDGGGGYSEEWATYASAWAAVRPLSGRERYQAQQVAASANYRIAIPNNYAVLPEDRILWRGKTLNIRFIADAGPEALDLVLEAEIDQ